LVKTKSELGLIFWNWLQNWNQKFLIFEEPDQEPDSGTRFLIPLMYGTEPRFLEKKKTTRTRD
jgi:hypothetical protein